MYTQDSLGKLLNRNLQMRCLLSGGATALPDQPHGTANL